MYRKKLSKAKSRRLFRSTGSVRASHPRNFSDVNPHNVLRYRGGIRL